MIYKMRCPKCQRQYGYDGEPYAIEHCPMGDCGYQGRFSDFIIEEKEITSPAEREGG